MRTRWRAFRSIRLNYTRRGVVKWLTAHHRNPNILYGFDRGWKRVWFDPERVEQEQHALADGAYL
jgi:hypothetical protein